MFTLFLLGNIASGKSFAARYLERKGALRIDLDQVAKDLYQPGSQVVSDLSDHFGLDILDVNGGIRTSVLARKAFSSPEETQVLNDIVHPVLLQQLALRLLPYNCCVPKTPHFEFAVVEISAPDSFTDALSLADQVMLISAPLDVRRQRALGRGMSLDDFERRAELQPTEEQLARLADVVIDNSGDITALQVRLDAWAAEHGFGSVSLHG